MSAKSSEEKDEEQASLMRQGAGNYANLCGVLAGFVAVMIVLVLTPGFFPSADSNVVFELVVVLFTIASFVYIFTAISFVDISAMALWEYKSLEDMAKGYSFCQALLFVCTVIFLGGVVVLNYSKGALLMTIAAAAGFILLASLLIKNWWALAKRPPPKKTK